MCREGGMCREWYIGRDVYGYRQDGWYAIVEWS